MTQETENLPVSNNPGTNAASLAEWLALTENTGDKKRQDAVEKQRAKGFRTARENLEHLVDENSFVEYGQLAIAAQRSRRTVEDLRDNTPADGVITGLATINADKFPASNTACAVAINDFTVLAGTQGYFHHLKLDRIFQVARKRQLPFVMYTEGGGGRPGDTDSEILGGVAIPDTAFIQWARLCNCVPTIAINNGFCFAGSAALFGCANIRIATKQSWIGMAGPAMIEGGGMGKYEPTDIGPTDIQVKNGVVDIVADDEAHATRIAQTILGYVQGDAASWSVADQSMLREVLPENRRFTYNPHRLIGILVDQDTFLPFNQEYGGALLTGLCRVEGKAVGIMANDSRTMAGAIDCDAAIKGARFIRLCNHLGLPLVSLCDTPGFMVGIESEAQGAVYHMSQMFNAAAEMTIPMVTVFIRRAYGLGAQAMSGGSYDEPAASVSWPSGEFGAMGFEGAVKLGFKKELDAAPSEEARAALYNELLDRMYAQGRAVEFASSTVFDAVIDPADTRSVIVRALW